MESVAILDFPPLDSLDLKEATFCASEVQGLPTVVPPEDFHRRI